MSVTVLHYQPVNESLLHLRGKYDHCKILDSSLAKAIKINCESVSNTYHITEGKDNNKLF